MPWVDVTSRLVVPRYAAPTQTGNYSGVGNFDAPGSLWQQANSYTGDPWTDFDWTLSGSGIETLALSGGLWVLGSGDDWAERLTFDSPAGGGILQEPILFLDEPLAARGVRATVRVSAGMVAYATGQEAAALDAVMRVTPAPSAIGSPVLGIGTGWVEGSGVLLLDTGADYLVATDEAEEPFTVSGISIAASAPDFPFNDACGGECGFQTPSGTVFWPRLLRLEVLTDAPGQFWRDFVRTVEVSA